MNFWPREKICKCEASVFVVAALDSGLQSQNTPRVLQQLSFCCLV